MKGNVNLSSNREVYFPPSVEPSFMGAHPPVKVGYGSMINDTNVNYFQNYRNDNLSKFQMPQYEWGIARTPYTPRPDIVALKGSPVSSLQPRKLDIGFSDMGRQAEMEDFYRISQLHRDQYNDHSGRLHPYDYFHRGEYIFQCPKDTTSTYIKFPSHFLKYRDPVVFPRTLDRWGRFPPLPDRCLRGTYEEK